MYTSWPAPAARIRYASGQITHHSTLAAVLAAPQIAMCTNSCIYMCQCRYSMVALKKKLSCLQPSALLRRQKGKGFHYKHLHSLAMGASAAQASRQLQLPPVYLAFFRLQYSSLSLCAVAPVLTGTQVGFTLLKTTSPSSQLPSHQQQTGIHLHAHPQLTACPWLSPISILLSSRQRYWPATQRNVTTATCHLSIQYKRACQHQQDSQQCRMDQDSIRSMLQVARRSSQC